MGLFSIENKLITIGDNIECYHIDKNNISSLMEFYSEIEIMNKICAYAMQGNLLFGGNNYYNVINGYLFLYHFNLNKVSLITIPFDKSGHFMRLSLVHSYMVEHNIYRIRCVLDTDFVSWDDSVPILQKYFNIKHEANEYFYDNKKISSLIGKEFSKMRNKFNRFEKDYPDVSYRWSTKLDISILNELYEKWKTMWGGSKYTTIFDGKYFQTMLSVYFDKFLIFFDSDKPIGFMGYCPSNDFNVHCGFRKLDIGYKYLTQYAQIKFCSELYKLGYKYTNDDSDDNRKGLRELKSSFQPIYIMKEYQLVLKEC